MPKVQTCKEDLIVKSAEVFLRNGYYHTSFSDLAKACEIEKSHFYYYFTDKRDLMNQCLIFFSGRIQKNVFDVSMDGSIKPSERIKKMLGFVWGLHSENGYGCLFGNTLLETVGKEPYFEPIIRDFFNQWKNALGHLYTEISLTTDLEQTAFDDIQKLQGSIMLMKLYNDKSILKRAINQISDRFSTFS
ncbi:TetR/AcrR family transcriptional regulator [Dyadobacter psychrotolerans]|uniref:TetR/AcrR family transcriptional regulator n=1 Tax=Dyadobacter psychrotolerans TaxID=2541721 RepID=A0A4R5DPV2_9BACT|nr:TetR/AcrR family transcriptional regulator [Dyadobacter psychrotolerans]TDE15637.1 TetR/AcrR family transcriptional regulator [Dyadobacter psychrotolerans]